MFVDNQYPLSAGWLLMVSMCWDLLQLGHRTLQRSIRLWKILPHGQRTTIMFTFTVQYT